MCYYYAIIIAPPQLHARYVWGTEKPGVGLGTGGNKATGALVCVAGRTLTVA